MKRLLVAFAAMLAACAHAQSWPSKPIRAVAPYPPGGGLDFVTRTVSQRLGEVLKQSVVVEKNGP